MSECDVCGTQFDRIEAETVVSRGRMWLFCSGSCKQQWEDDNHE